MNNDKNVLPEDFDGVFRFTNFTEEDFTAKWNNIAYTYPAMKTTPMIIPSTTAEEVQTIRKKFARELAEREFYKSPKFKKMDATPVGGSPALYTDSDLKEFISKCLEPLPVAQAKVVKLPKDSTKYSENTIVLDEKDFKAGKSLTANNSGEVSI